MIMPKNFLALIKSQTSGGRSRHSQLIFQSSSIAQSSSTGPCRKASSSAVSLAGAKASNFDQSGLPVKRSAPHQTSPASSASRSVSDIAGNTPRAQEKIGLVMKSRRKLMALSLLSVARRAPHLCQTTTHPNGKHGLRGLFASGMKRNINQMITGPSRIRSENAGL